MTDIATRNHEDTARDKMSFLTAVELLARHGDDNVILDAQSTLVGRTVKLGVGNVLYPGVVIEQSGEGTIAIGDSNRFYPGTFILCSGGSVTIGSANEFGPNGCSLRANMAASAIEIGDNGRYCDGANVMGQTNLGSGSQVIGVVTVQSCQLAAGDDFRGAEPDERAAVLKGYGLARNLTIATGQVVNGTGNFADAPIEWQRAHHPKLSS